MSADRTTADLETVHRSLVWVQEWNRELGSTDECERTVIRALASLTRVQSALTDALEQRDVAAKTRELAITAAFDAKARMEDAELREADQRRGAEYERARADAAEVVAANLYWRERAEAAEARVEELQRALQPFAELSDAIGDEVPVLSLVHHYGKDRRPTDVLRIADLRAAPCCSRWRAATAGSQPGASARERVRGVPRPARGWRAATDRGGRRDVSTPRCPHCQGTCVKRNLRVFSEWWCESCRRAVWPHWERKSPAAGPRTEPGSETRPDGGTP